MFKANNKTPEDVISNKNTEDVINDALVFLL